MTETFVVSLHPARCSVPPKGCQSEVEVPFLSRYFVDDVVVFVVMKTPGVQSPEN